MSGISEPVKGTVVAFARDAEFFRRRVARLRSAGREEEALTLLRLTVQQDPASEETVIELAEMLVEMGWPRLAVASAAGALVREGASAECYIAMAMSLCALGCYRAASQAVLYYLARAQDDRAWEQGMSLLMAIEGGVRMQFTGDRQRTRRQKKLKRLARWMEEGRYQPVACAARKDAQGDENPLNWVILAMAEYHLGKTEGAIAAARQALTGGRVDDVTRLTVSGLFAKMGRMDEAESVLAQVNLAGLSGEERQVLVGTLCALGRHGQVLEEVLPMLAQAPGNRALLLLAGTAYENLGLRPQAVQCWQRMLRVDPADVLAGYYAGREEAETGDLPYDGRLSQGDMRRLFARLAEAPVRRDVRLALQATGEAGWQKGLDAAEKLEGQEREELLREFLLNPAVHGAARERARRMLVDGGARRPIASLAPDAFFAEGEARMKISLRRRRLMERLMGMLGEEKLDAWYRAVALCLKSDKTLRVAPRSENAVTAALHLLTLGRADGEDSIKVARKYGVSLRRLIYTAQRLQDARMGRTEEK